MTMSGQTAILRIYTQERARAGNRALFEEVVRQARDHGLAGATVLRGPMGFGASHAIHNAGILDLSSNLPMVIELVDEEAKLRAFFAEIATLDDIGLVTISPLEVLHYG